MKRRDALKQLSAVSGAIIAVHIVSGILAGCRASGDACWRPEILSDQQNDMVTVIAERIIPCTDTRGAADAAVNRLLMLLRLTIQLSGILQSPIWH